MQAAAAVAVPITGRKTAAAVRAAEVTAAAAAAARSFSALSLSDSGGCGYLAFSFDLEATGLNVLSARILDIAVVEVESGR